MIISHRSTNPSYTTDSVAQNLRGIIAAPAIQLESRAQEAPRDAAPQTLMNLGALYPALYAPARRPPLAIRAVRGLTFRLSVFGTAAAAILLLVHH